MSWETVRFGDLYAVESRNGLTKPGKVRGSGYKMINMGELFANDRIYDIIRKLLYILLFNGAELERSKDSV